MAIPVQLVLKPNMNEAHHRQHVEHVVAPFTVGPPFSGTWENGVLTVNVRGKDELVQLLIDCWNISEYLLEKPWVGSAADSQYPIHTIEEYIERVLALRIRWSPQDPYPEIWFRGVNDELLPLLPGAYWRKRCDEKSLVLSFQNMVPSYISREPIDDWEWYYLMQHYGLPTRLLDWTENPLIALYFALVSATRQQTPCVWVMDPVKLNKVAHGATEDLIVVPVSRGQEAPYNYWLPEWCGRHAELHTFPSGSRYTDNSKPIAVFPKRYNPRIVAQRGVFTVHGKDETPIEAILGTATDPNDQRIERIPIDRSQVGSLLDDLWTLGFTKSSLFPEPQSVAEDLKRSYGVQ